MSYNRKAILEKRIVEELITRDKDEDKDLFS
jgi:hypothetical protein